MKFLYLMSASQLSVIVAGGTGSTGREVVSKLVAHPRVKRVVVLSRYPIPVNRWQTTFPNIRTVDALKHLSIVAVDWAKLDRDTKGVPIALVSDASRRTHLEPMACSSAGQLPDPQAQQYSQLIAESRHSRKVLADVMRSTFYRSIFSGHHVAVNCLGSHNVFNPRSVESVDHDFAIAFGKLVRIFNCSPVDTEVEAIREEFESLCEAAALSSGDSTVWKEICSAFLGKDGTRIGASSVETRNQALVDFMNLKFEQIRTEMLEVGISGGEIRPAKDGHPSKFSKPTLMHYSQISTAGASSISPFPYFRAHGQCDVEIADLFGFDAHYPHRTDDAIDFAEVAKHQSSLPLSRNSVSVTIWKPGLLKRPKARLAEKLLSFLAPPVAVESLSQMIVDDIINSTDPASRHISSISPPKPIKVVHAKHISIKAAMLEQGRNSKVF